MVAKKKIAAPIVDTRSRQVRRFEARKGKIKVTRYRPAYDYSRNADPSYRKPWARDYNKKS